MGIAGLARNPIYEREFVAFCRTRRWFVLRTALVALLTITVWVFLWGMSVVGRVDNLDVIGQALFAASCMAQVGFVFLITPAMVADLIVGERRRRSLDLILASPISPWSVVGGKLLSRLSLLAVMIAAAFPVITISLLYGGVRASQVAGLFGVTLGTMLFAAGPAILVSAFARRLGTAASLSYVVPLALSVLFPILVHALVRDDLVRGGILARTHFLFAAIYVQDPDLAQLLRLFGLPPVAAFLLFSTVWCATFAALAVLRLRAERHGASGFLLRRGARSRRRAFRRMGNPMLWKEVNLVNASHSRVLFLISVGLLLLAEVLFASLVPADELADEILVHFPLLVCEMVLIYIVVSVNGATSVVSEREAHTLELVNISLLPTGHITSAKVLGTLRSVLILAAVPVLHVFAYSLASPITAGGAIGFSLPFTMLLVFFAAVAVRISITATTPARAVVRSMVLLAGLLIGLPLATGILAFFTIASTGGGEIMEFLFVAHPLVLPLYPFSHLSEPSRGEEQLLVMAMVWVVLYGVATMLTILQMSWAYRRSFERNLRAT